MEVFTEGENGFYESALRYRLSGMNSVPSNSAAFAAPNSENGMGRKNGSCKVNFHFNPL